MRRSVGSLFGTQGSWFPLLAVWLAAAGGLLALLIGAVDRQQVVQRLVTDERDELMADEAAAEWRVDQLKQSQAKTEAALGAARLDLSHLEDHLRRLRARGEELRTAVAALEADKVPRAAEKAAELARLKAEADATEKSLTDADRESNNRPVKYSVVPYEGPFHTNRRPVYLECRKDSIVLQPEGVVFGEQDFEGPLGPSNPLAASMRAVREYLAKLDAQAVEKQEPYPLLLVRPDAIASYYVAQAALHSWGSQFGYELIGSDWQLDFPAADDQLAKLLLDVIARARIEQKALIAAAPREYRKERKPFTSKPGPGEQGGPGGQAGNSKRGAKPPSNPYRNLVGNQGRGGGNGPGGNTPGATGGGGNSPTGTGGQATGGRGLAGGNVPGGGSGLGTGGNANGSGPGGQAGGGAPGYNSLAGGPGNGANGSGNGPGGAANSPFGPGGNGNGPAGLGNGLGGTGNGTGGNGTSPNGLGGGPGGLAGGTGAGGTGAGGTGPGGTGPISLSNGPGGNGAGLGAGGGTAPGMNGLAGGNGNGLGNSLLNGNGTPNAGGNGGGGTGPNGLGGNNGTGLGGNGTGANPLAGTGGNGAGGNGSGSAGTGGTGTGNNGQAPGGNLAAGQGPNVKGGAGSTADGADGTGEGGSGVGNGNASGGSNPGTGGDFATSTGTNPANDLLAGTPNAGLPGRGSSGGGSSGGGTGQSALGGGASGTGTANGGNQSNFNPLAGAGQSSGPGLPGGSAGSQSPSSPGGFAGSTDAGGQASSGSPSTGAQSVNAPDGTGMVSGNPDFSVPGRSQNLRGGSQTRVPQTGGLSAGGTGDTSAADSSTAANNSGGGSGSQRQRGGGSSSGGSSSSSAANSSQSSGGGGNSSPQDPSQQQQAGGMPMPNLNFGDKQPPPPPKRESLAKSRGQGWALPDTSGDSIGVSRPVVVVVNQDRMTVLSEDGKSVLKEIRFGPQTTDAVDELRNTVTEQSKSWGAAGKGFYWKPSLSMRVAPDGRARFNELQGLFADSGLDLRESSRTAPTAKSPSKRSRK